MKKQELIDYLVDTYHEDKNELKNMKKDELEDKYTGVDWSKFEHEI